MGPASRIVPGVVRNGGDGAALAILGFYHHDSAQEIITVPGGELGIFGKDDRRDVHVVIDPFETIHDRPAPEGYAAAIRFDERVRLNPLDFHGEIQLDHVARLPSPCDIQIAVVKRLSREALAVHGNSSEIAPVRNTEIQRKLLRFLGRDGQFHTAVPRIPGTLLERNRVVAQLNPGVALRVEIHVDLLAIGGIEIPRHVTAGRE